MAAAYDSYDYPKYWEDRSYEHKSEVLAINAFLGKIKKIKRIADIGCGFGRLTPHYSYRSKRIVLVDPSSRLLKEAKRRLSNPKVVLPNHFKKVSFVQSTIKNLNKNFRKNEFDLVMMIRVLHHIEDPNDAFERISRIIAPGGYFILEFANKLHWKALSRNILKGNFTFPIDIFPDSKLSQKNKEKKTLPFLNYHPDIVTEILKKNKFKIIEKRSVSNVRSPFFKKHLPLPLLLSFEKYIQKPLAYLHFGPSLFILARKRG